MEINENSVCLSMSVSAVKGLSPDVRKIKKTDFALREVPAQVRKEK